MDTYPQLRKCLVVGIILLFIGMSIIPSTAQNTEISNLSISDGKWWYVGGSGPGNYSRIQDAVDHASDGDTVFVFEGTYYENILIQTAINLLGENEYMTTIIGDYSGNYLSTITIQHSNVILKGFTVKGTSYAIGLYANYVTVENNHISGTQGIYVGSSYNSILYNNITGYGLPGSFPGRGIELWNSNNKIEHNSIFSGYGIECAAASDNFINDNLIVQNDGTILYGGAMDVISNNTFRGSGLWLEGVSGNIIVSNNTVNGKPLVFLDNISNRVIDYDTGQVIIVRCDNVTIENQNFSHSPYSVQVISSRYCDIVNNTISYCFGTFDLGAGVAIYSSDSIKVMDNTIEESEIQIGQYGFGYNHNITVSRNTNRSQNLGYRISIQNTYNCTLSYNNVASLELYFFCYNCSILCNNFVEKKSIVIYVPVGSHNVLNGNYWGKPRVAPKVIRGTVFKGTEWPWELVRPWFFIDWHPAQKPYDIS